MSPVPPPAKDPVLAQIEAASARMFAGLVPPQTVLELRQSLRAADAYPWQEANARVLADPVAPEQLVDRALRAQRDWIVRGGAAGAAPRPRRRMAGRGKVFLAVLLTRLLFFVPYTAAVIALLVLLKHRWPELDIYRLLDWLRHVLPGVFGPR